MAKKPSVGPPNQKLAPSVTSYHGQLSSSTISENANDPILRKLSDGQTGRKDFIECCPLTLSVQKQVYKVVPV